MQGVSASPEPVRPELWSSGDGPGPLAGVRVLDFGQYIAGPLAAGLLADQGADVIHVDPPGGPRWDHPANAALLRSRRSIVLDLKAPSGLTDARRLVASADIVIENFRPGVMTRLGLGPTDCLQINRRLVYCSMPGFGADDPRAGVAAWEGVVMAAGGAYAADTPLSFLGSLSSDVQANFCALPLASVFAAIECALGATAALVARDRDGYGQSIEVALFDALFEASGVRAMSFEREFPKMTQFGAGYYRCADGRYVSLATMWLRHLRWFVEAAGAGRWADDGLVDFDRLWSDPEVGTELCRRLVELFASRPAAEWEEIGRRAGVPLAMVRSMDEWMAEPQATGSDTLVDLVDPALGTLRLPGAAVEVAGALVTARPRHSPGEDTAAVIGSLGPATPPLPAPSTLPAGDPPLTGVRVVDLTRVLAGPTAARLLGQLGAEVTKVDADPAASTCCIPEPMVHEHANRGKRGIALDLTTDDGLGVLHALLGRSDVVVQNFTVGVAERLGIDFESLERRTPGVVLVYLNAYGARGPWARDRGYAELANVVTGLTERTISADHPSGPPNTVDLPPWPFTDYAAGVLGAFGAVVGIYGQRRTGRAQLVETSLVRAATLEQVIYALRGPGVVVDEPRGPETLGWSPDHRLFKAADGWLFGAAGATQWADAARAIGVTAGWDGSGADRETLVADAVSTMSVADAVEQLQRAGVSAHEVHRVPDLMVPDGPAARRGIRAEEQTERFGSVVMAGPVLRLHRTPLRVGSLPGPFGAEGPAILAELAQR